MSATGELRRLLDERGVRWWPDTYYKDTNTCWRTGGFEWRASEHDGDLIVGGTHTKRLTPEQAIEVTVEREILRAKVSVQAYEIERLCAERQVIDKQYERHGLEDMRTIEALEAEIEDISARVSSGELVEVVRCRDCVHSKPAEEDAVYYCDKGTFGLMGGSAYCSLGKRKGDGR